MTAPLIIEFTPEESERLTARAHAHGYDDPVAYLRALVGDEQVAPPLPDETDEAMPSAAELLVMPKAQRDYWIQRSLALARDEEFERFDAFGEEEF
jgi:hypothetical protein